MGSNSNKKYFLLNLLFAYGYNILLIVLGLSSVPIALSYWHAEKYGVWTIITSLAVYLSISGLGIDVASGLLMTKNSNLTVKKIIFRKGLAALIASGILISILMILLYILNPEWLKIIGKMSNDSFKEAKITATIVIIFFLINLPFGVVTNSFAAYEKAYLNSIFNTILALLNFSALIVTVLLKLNLPIFGMLYGIINLVVNILKTFVYFRVTGKVNINNEIIENKDGSYKTILLMGMRLTLYGVAIMVSSNVGNLIISNNIDVAKVVPYSLVYKLFFIAFSFLYTFNNSSAPLLGKEFGEGNWEWIKKAYDKLFIITVFTASFIIIGSVLFMEDILFLWVGKNNYIGMPTVIVLGMWFFIGGLSNVNYIIINSFNYTKGIVYSSWGETITFIIVSILLVNKIGALGVAVGSLIGALIFSSWLLPLIVYKRSGERLKYNWKYFIINITMVFIVIIISVFVQNEIKNIAIRIAFSIFILIGYLIFSLKVFPNEIKQYMLALLTNKTSLKL